MTVRKLPSGKWICECYPGGRDGKRLRKQFATKGEAVAYENHIMGETESKPWLGEKQDSRHLSEIINLWYSLYGQTLSSPEKLLNKLKMICHNLGDPLAVDVTPGVFTSFRERRLKGEAVDVYGVPMAAIKPKTANLDQSNLSAVFGTLKKLGHWKAPNPIAGIPLFKITQSELTFLSQQEIKKVLDACVESLNPDLLMVTRICLATGARWSEAEKLNRSQVTQYRVTFTKTKGKKNRTVPISKELYGEIPNKHGRLFQPCRKAFERAIKRAGIDLPEGQCTHVLRHTFASHFMMNGGNILVLREILGHADIKMTMVYAHFAPDHLDDAVTKNPLSNLTWTRK
ncbi:site-specific integrase [Erwinia aphidicola]|uniref:site-specific integrase n=1 Tax=Erwinia aphidicola TaxID=68334 RepID=UPI0020A0A798|nr:site-specific integrase [Erwinia aphidicola]MCP2230173.1 integrase [Erwinia aphidicola]